MRSHVKKKKYREHVRAMVIAGMATDSEGHWHEADKLDGRHGCKASMIRSVQAGYKMSRTSLYS